jgi:hypothetical protein
MKRNTLGWSMAGALALSCTYGSVFAQGESAPPAPPAVPAMPAVIDAPKPEYTGPSAREIIERYIEVTGGRAAYEKITNRQQTGAMEVPSQGVKGTTTMLQAAPNKMMMTIDLGGFGSQRMGTDGEVAWSVDTIQGARVLEGQEKVSTIRQATFNSELNWESLFKDVKAESEEMIDGKPAYAVTMVSEDGQKLTNFYDKESGLLVRSATIAKNQMGDMPVQSAFTDYRDVDGVKIAHKTIIDGAMGIQIVMTLDSVKLNSELPADAFALPDEVKKLQEATKPAESPASAPVEPEKK